MEDMNLGKSGKILMLNRWSNSGAICEKLYSRKIIGNTNEFFVTNNQKICAETIYQVSLSRKIYQKRPNLGFIFEFLKIKFSDAI